MIFRTLNKHKSFKESSDPQKHILKHIFLFAANGNMGLYLRYKPKTIFFTLKKIIPIEDLKSDFEKKSLFIFISQHFLFILH